MKGAEPWENPLTEALTKFSGIIEDCGIQSNREDMGSRLEKAALPWASRHATPSRPSLSSCLCEMGPLCPSCFPRDGYVAVLQGRSEPFHPLHLLAVSFIVIFPLSHTHSTLPSLYLLPFPLLSKPSSQEEGGRVAPLGLPFLQRLDQTLYPAQTICWVNE